MFKKKNFKKSKENLFQKIKSRISLQLVFYANFTLFGIIIEHFLHETPLIEIGLFIFGGLPIFLTPNNHSNFKNKVEPVIKYGPKPW